MKRILVLMALLLLLGMVPAVPKCSANGISLNRFCVETRHTGKAPEGRLVASLLSTKLYAAPPTQVDSVRDMWIDVSMGAPLVDWFNRTARPDDIARVENIAQIELLDRITVGRKLVVFKSVDDAERLVPEIANQIDIIGYNLESGPANPLEEQENPVESVQRMRELADHHGLLLAVGPDRDFALTNGPEMAPYVDIFVLQVQRAQTDPFQVRNFVEPLAAQLREANPDLQISVQVRTEGDVVALVDLIASLQEQLDGVSILTSPETVTIAEDLVHELRTWTPATPTATAGIETPELPTAQRTPTVQAGAERTPIRLTPVATSTPAPGAAGGASDIPWIPVIAVAAGIGSIVGAVAATIVCTATRRS